MGFIERLRQEAEARELEQRVRQARLAETKTFSTERKDQAAAFRTESGIGDLVSEAAVLLKKVRLTDASYSKSAATQKQVVTEAASVFDSIIWDKRETPLLRSRLSYKYVSLATRPSGEIIFYAKEEILIPAIDWRNDKDILERTLEQALNSPGQAREPEKDINYPTYIHPLKPDF